MKVMEIVSTTVVLFIVVFAFAQISCGDNNQTTKTKPDQATAANNKSQAATATKEPKPVPPGTEARVGDEDNHGLFCTDPDLMDFALDAAHMGNSYDAMNATRDSKYFSVRGPVKVRVKDSRMKSRWPKVFVEILDGDSAGQSGWIQFSELKDVKEPAK